MEFVIVTFPVVRGVRMDGAPEGQTGEVINVERGTHRFDLGEPLDYQPPRQRVRVFNTSELAPMVIAFDPIVDDIETPAPAPPPPPPAVTARSRRRTKKQAPKKKAARKKAAKKKSAKKTKGAKEKKKTVTRRRSRKRSHRRTKKA